MRDRGTAGDEHQEGRGEERVSTGETGSAGRAGADDAREQVLSRIRTALQGAAAAEPPLARAYLTESDLEREALLADFVERARDYRVIVREVGGDGIPGAIADACRDRGAVRLVVPPDLPQAWLSPGFEWVRDEGLSAAALEEADGVLTGCALAIAQTGTLVLDGGAWQGRRILSLLPDYHLCVVRAEQVVGLVPEAFARLAGTAHERPLTLISGPSATSDIELSRVEGVHGPRTLEVILVGD